MKRFRVVLLVAVSMMIAGMTFAAVSKKEAANGPLTQRSILQRYGFIDENGDGINDLARDSDNDGIPNCLDTDWVRPRDGSGFQSKYGYMHQNASDHGAGFYNYSYNYGWHNNWAGSNSNCSNPNFSNQTGQDGNTNHNRRTNRKH